MVDIKTAYKIVNDFFVENEYIGVDETRDSGECWLFSGKLNQTMYGTSEVCVPKSGEDSYAFSI